MFGKVSSFFVCLLLAGSVSAAVYTYETKADWDFLWEINADNVGGWRTPNTRGQIDLNYHRFVVMPGDRDRATKLAAVLGWTSSTRLMIYHCGFCWSMEVLQEELGLARVIGVQQSAYIQGAKATDESTDVRRKIETAFSLPLDAVLTGDALSLYNTLRNDGQLRSVRPADIMDEAFADSASRQRIRDRLGGPGFEIVTWQILGSLEDAEVLELDDRLNRLTSGRITHFVTTRAGCCFIARTLDEYKALLPSRTFVKSGTFEVRE